MTRAARARVLVDKALLRAAVTKSQWSVTTDRSGSNEYDRAHVTAVAYAQNAARGWARRGGVSSHLTRRYSTIREWHIILPCTRDQCECPPSIAAPAEVPNRVVTCSPPDRQQTRRLLACRDPGAGGPGAVRAHAAAARALGG